MPWVDDHNAALLTDLYELTMAASYFGRGMGERATFDLFVRALPPERNFLIACGIEDALDYLEGLHFEADATAYLRTLEMFDEAFLAYLGQLRFSGDAWAVAEGEAVFAGEPLLSVTAPLVEAQVVETFLLNCVTFQTVVASKAARLAIACRGRPFVDFSPRRDHGADAALKSARAAAIGGAAATSNLLAGQHYGLALSGTMAHSYVLAFGDEATAFRAYARDFPGRAVLLIDTFDTLEGARKAAAIASELRDTGTPVRGVRLDSGDLLDLAPRVRRILDAAGCEEVEIFASGDLDEYRIAELLDGGAPVDAFGVGTRLGTSADAPSLSSVYKLVDYAGRGVAKLASGKETLPGRKQVYRVSENGTYSHDVLALADEPAVAGRPLLTRVMAGGNRLEAASTISDAQGRCRQALLGLPKDLLGLGPAAGPYQVRFSPALVGAYRAAAGPEASAAEHPAL